MEIKLAPLTDYQLAAITNPYKYFAMFAGIAAGKSAAGSHFVIKHVLEHPDKTGIIGANTQVQLSTATLRELFFWLNRYGFEFCIDRQPPLSWGLQREFKDYRNVLIIWNPWARKASTWFTRIMSEPDNLRGLTAAVVWLDELRDTPSLAFDIILSRLRESDYIKVLVTTTPCGEDWSYQRFVKSDPNQRLYGSMHVRTEESVKAGIITREFYDSLLASYSEMMIAQELEALHVNVFGGRAYYAFSNDNRKPRAPWGFKYPNPQWPLIIGCDFNFDPAPHVWTVSQKSPDGKKIHVFKELSGLRKSTPQMAQLLCSQFPGFHYRVFGDRSGARATTSNAGKHDYDQMGEVFALNGITYSMDTDTGNNPLVRNRVENMNRMAKNGLGVVSLTYDPDGCPLLDRDFKMVGWKQTNLKGQGKLDSGGDVQLTHASDSLGYSIWKLFPFGQRGKIIGSIPSLASKFNS